MKKNIAIVCGGQNTEHNISLLSASNVIAELNHDKFNAVIIYITREGQWLLASNQADFIQQASQMYINVEGLASLYIQPGFSKSPFVNQKTGEPIKIDCFFPVLHGFLGEDGTIQGLFELLKVPYVGCGTLSSAIGMEKDFAKQLCRRAGIETLDWLVMHYSEKDKYTYTQITEQLSSVVFIKTVSSGSSIGVFKVRNESEYKAAMDIIFDLDDKIIIEKAVVARELEISVIGNNQLESSGPSEAIAHDDFYTYETKYFKPEALEIIIPAPTSEILKNRLHALALQIYRALSCHGFARIDFLVVSEDEIYLNEVNTLPGFTASSAFPKMWTVAGLAYPDLLTKLIELSFESDQRKKSLSLNHEKFVNTKSEKQSAV